MCWYNELSLLWSAYISVYGVCLSTTLWSWLEIGLLFSCHCTTATKYDKLSCLKGKQLCKDGIVMRIYKSFHFVYLLTDSFCFRGTSVIKKVLSHFWGLACNWSYCTNGRDQTLNLAKFYRMVKIPQFCEMPWGQFTLVSILRMISACTYTLCVGSHRASLLAPLTLPRFWPWWRYLYHH